MSVDAETDLNYPQVQSPGREPTVRKLASVSAVAFAGLTLITLVALMASSAVYRHAMDSVSRNTRSAALTSEVEVAVLMYQRLGNLHVLTGEAEVDKARDGLVPQIRDALVEARGLVAGPREQRLLDSVDARLRTYMTERRRAETQGLALATVVQQVRPALTDLLTDLRNLRELNDAQVIDARSEALRLDGLATMAGAAAGVMLILGSLVIAWGVRRFLVRPVVTLHQAMDRFSGGDLEARAGTAGVREVSELARMFNDMASNLAQQRRAQLTFLAGVAHDLKNPLSTLKTGVYTLAYEPSALRRSDTRLTLDRQVDLLNRMVGDLLDATRIEAGELELRRKTFDLRRLVEDVISLYVPAAPDHQLGVRLPEQPVMVDADWLRIEQVVRNLLSNAIKFSPYGGAVTVAVESAGSETVLAVSDSGVGMTAEDMKTIFLPFRRRKLNGAPGAGLGLSVVRRIVRAHGGAIAVESQPGDGSCFRITLPLVPAPA